MKVDFKNRKVRVAVALIGILLFLSFLFWRFNSGGGKDKGSEEIGNALPETEILPTVDKSVTVAMKANALKREVTLTIDNIPTGTTDIEYELSYNTKGDLPKGVIGTFTLESNESRVEREITLGTCSSGACVYDEGVESVRVSLKFNSDAGSKVFEKEFEI